MKILTPFIFFIISVLGFSQQIDHVDFRTAKIEVSIKPDSAMVSGLVKYKFKVLKSVDSLFIDAVRMKFDSVYLNGKKVNYFNDSSKLWIVYDFKSNKTYDLSFYYEASPKKAMYFIDWEFDEGNKQVWTQGQGKYTSNWLPSIDDMNDKIAFDMSITFDKDYDVIANGKLIDKQTSKSTAIWYYDMQKPMSSYLVALAIGKYNKKVEYSKSNIPLEMYYYPKDSLKVEPTYRYTKQMFDFLEEEIGVSYPWQNYKQIPVKDFLYAGMENTGTTIFADSFVVDSVGFVDKNYVNVNAHELAHQWFGNLVTETSGTHHWLQEGFATYYALLAERNIFGEDYYYKRLYEYAQELLQQDKAGGSTSLLNPKSSSITFYKKGAWVLHMLREKVGDRAFKTAIKSYLLKHRFKNVDTKDFIKEVEKTSGEDLSEFVEIWLMSERLYFDKMLNSIKSNKMVAKMYEFDKTFKTVNASEEGVYSLNFKRDLPVLKAFYADFKNRDATQFKKDVNYNDKAPLNFYKVAFMSKDIKVRQAIAKALSKIPLELKTDYETLLDDKSYLTIEAALFGLWNNFPEEQNKYLKKTKGKDGFSDKNIRMLWLTLALISDDFESENSEHYFNELVGYTSSKYGFEVRQNAFSYLAWIRSCVDACQENLKQATKHHSWRFSKFAKQLLKDIN